MEGMGKAVLEVGCMKSGSGVGEEPGLYLAGPKEAGTDDGRAAPGG